jgi:hypothetical protein
MRQKHACTWSILFEELFIDNFLHDENINIVDGSSKSGRYIGYDRYVMMYVIYAVNVVSMSIHLEYVEFASFIIIMGIISLC